MRLEIPLTLIIIALIVLGGLIVDEKMIREDYRELESRVQQLQEALQASDEQVRQLTEQLDSVQAQVYTCNSLNASLSQAVTDLQAKNNRLQLENELLRLAGTRNNPALASGLVGIISAGMIYGSVWSVRRLRVRRKPASECPNGNLRATYIRLSGEEIRELIRQRRRHMHHRLADSLGRGRG